MLAKIYKRATVTRPTAVGHNKTSPNFFHLARRQGKSGATPIRTKIAAHRGAVVFSKKGGPTTIFSPVRASEKSGKWVPHQTITASPRKMRLLSKKKDSRESRESSSF
jgi:hypothetical protein